MKDRLLRALLVLALSTAVGCAHDPTTPSRIPVSITVTPRPVVIPQFGTQQLSATLVDQHGDTIHGLVPTYIALTSGLITVSNAGLVTSIGPAGSGLVVASSATLADTVPVSVTPVATTIQISPSPASVRQKMTRQLTATVLDAVGVPIAGASLSYQSQTPSLVTVSSDGVVTSLGPAGQASVLVTSASAGVLTQIRVVPVPASVGGLPQSLTMGGGGYFPLRGAWVRDLNGQQIPAAVVSYAVGPGMLVNVLGSGFLHAGLSFGPTSLIASYADSVGQVADTIPITVQQYGIPTGTIIDTFPTGGPAYGVAVSSQGAVYVTISGAVRAPLMRMDLPATQFGQPITGVGAGLGVAFNPAGTLAMVAMVGQDSTSIIDPASNTLVSYLDHHITGDPRDVIFSPDGARAYVATTSTEIFVVNTTTDSVVDSIYVPGLPNQFSLHPTSHRLYAGLDNSQVAEIDTDSLRVTRLLAANGGSFGTAVAPDGSEVYTVNENNIFNAFDLGTGSQVANVHGLGGFSIVAGPDGSRLYVAGGSNVKIIDRLGRSLVDSIVVGGGARRIAVSPDGGALFVANEMGWLNVIY